MIAEKILLDAAHVNIEDNRSICEEIDRYLSWAMNVACLREGEFPDPLFQFNKVDFYSGQIENGGHKQFARNSRMDEKLFELIARGLHGMGVPEFREVFQDFRGIMNSNAELREEVMRAPYGAPPKALVELDRRFFGLGGSDKLSSSSTAWLKSLDLLVVLEPEELALEKAAILARNTKIEERRTEMAALRERTAAETAVHTSARQLCKLKGLNFLGVLEGFQTSLPKTIRWTIQTNAGPYYMLMGPEQVQLRDCKTRQVLATVASPVRPAKP